MLGDDDSSNWRTGCNEKEHRATEHPSQPASRMAQSPENHWNPILLSQRKHLSSFLRMLFYWKVRWLVAAVLFQAFLVRRIAFALSPFIEQQKVESSCSLSATARQDVDEVRLLLQSGKYNPNTANEDGLTPIHQCSIDNSDKLLRLLIEYSGDVNAKDRDLWTPLHAAGRSRFSLPFQFDLPEPLD